MKISKVYKITESSKDPNTSTIKTSCMDLAIKKSYIFTWSIGFMFFLLFVILLFQCLIFGTWKTSVTIKLSFTGIPEIMKKKKI